MTNTIAAVCGALAIAGLTVTAQPPQPSTTRPQTPEAAARTTAGGTITVTGCVALADMSMTSGEAGETPGRDVSSANKTAAVTKYILTNVQHAPGGATSSTGTADHQQSLALTTDGTTVDLSKHLDHKVELTGTLDTTSQRSPQAASTGTSGSTGTATRGRDAAAMRMPAATLLVTSLKMVSTTCP